MKTRELVVTFEKRLSDGNYGSELASAQVSGELEPGDDVDEAAIELMTQARSFVEAQLSQSRSLAVRLALHPPERAQVERPALSAPPMVLLEDHPTLESAPTGAPVADQFELEELPF